MPDNEREQVREPGEGIPTSRLPPGVGLMGGSKAREGAAGTCDGGGPVRHGGSLSRGVTPEISHGQWKGITLGSLARDERVLLLSTEFFPLPGGETPQEHYFTDKDSRLNAQRPTRR